MLRRLIIALAILLGTSVALDAQYVPSLTAFAFEQITFTNTATSLTAATYAPTNQNRPATLATLVCETASATLRARWDGTAPTSTVGVIINQGDAVTINGLVNIQQFQGIRTAATSVVCDVHYYRTGT